MQYRTISSYMSAISFMKLHKLDYDISFSNYQIFQHFTKVKQFSIERDITDKNKYLHINLYFGRIGFL
jgi:hypothetical protein